MNTEIHKIVFFSSLLECQFHCPKLSLLIVSSDLSKKNFKNLYPYIKHILFILYTLFWTFFWLTNTSWRYFHISPYGSTSLKNNCLKFHHKDVSIIYVTYFYWRTFVFLPGFCFTNNATIMTQATLKSYFSSCLVTADAALHVKFT